MTPWRFDMKQSKLIIELKALNVLAKSITKNGYSTKKLLKATEKAIHDGVEELLETPKWKKETRAFIKRIKREG